MPRRREPHEIKALAESIRSEVEGDAADMAQVLLGETLADTRKVNRPRYLDWIARHWVSEPGFAAALLDRLAPKGPTGQRSEPGLRAYLKDVRDAFAATLDVSTPPPYFQMASQALQMPEPNPMAQPGQSVAQPAPSATATAVAVPPVQPGGV